MIMNANKQLNSQQQAVVRVMAYDAKAPGLNSQKRQWKGLFWSIALFILMSLTLLACNSGQDQPPQGADTAGLAAFQAQQLADSLAAANPQATEQNQTQDQGGEGAAVNQNNSSNSNADNGNYADETGEDVNDGSYKSDNDVSGNTVDNGSGGAVDQRVNNDVGETTAPVKKKKKQAGKDALIGAGSGAVIGAIISKKNRGLGAVIGAAVGGGAGYGIGKHKDNKNKRESE